MTPEERQSIVDVAEALNEARQQLMTAFARANVPGQPFEPLPFIEEVGEAAKTLTRHTFTAERLVMQFKQQ